MTVEDIQNRWAERKYGLENVTRVDFNVYNGAEGCPTCGPDPAYVEVMVWYGKTQVKSFEERYTTDLINSIVEEAVRSIDGD
jgi:hypothetical protein